MQPPVVKSLKFFGCVDVVRRVIVREEKSASCLFLRHECGVCQIPASPFCSADYRAAGGRVVRAGHCPRLLRRPRHHHARSRPTFCPRDGIAQGDEFRRLTFGRAASFPRGLHAAWVPGIRRDHAAVGAMRPMSILSGWAGTRAVPRAVVLGRAQSHELTADYRGGPL